MKILSLRTREVVKLNTQNCGRCISLIFSLPFRNIPSERLFSLLKLIKTDIRNSFQNVTLVSLIRVSYWLKNEDKTSSAVSIPKAVAGFKTKANALHAMKSWR